MAWNEPGGGGRDPWGGRDGGSGPPDLDELLRKAQARLRGVLGGKGGGGGGGGRGGALGIGLLLIIALVVWIASGIYIIDPPERGVVLRFGEYVDTTLPGPHWHLPYPIETVEKVNVDHVRAIEVGYRSIGEGNRVRPVPDESLMLTQDENIVDLRVHVQYVVSDAQAYLFNVREPDQTMRSASESAIREVVGKKKMDFVITEGRGEVAKLARTLLQEIMDRYDAGLEVTNFTLQKAQPPEQVQAAFEDAIKAREDRVRARNKAQGYANEVIQQAQGNAARVLEEAQAYKEKRIARAEGEADRFTDVMGEYQRSPVVTRKRLYLETMQGVLSGTSKVVVDVKGGNNLMYLPLDKLIRQRQSSVQSSAQQSAKAQQSQSNENARGDPRERGRTREVR